MIFDDAPSLRLSWIRALLVPADPARPAGVLIVPPTAVGLSDAIGGGLLDDAVYATVNELGYCVYLDEQRNAHGLPGNPRAAVLAARLGWESLAGQLGLRGDALVAGISLDGNDTDVPLAVLVLARLAGVIRHPVGP